MGFEIRSRVRCRPILVRVLAATMALHAFDAAAAAGGPAASNPGKPAVSGAGVSRYELATPQDQLFAHLLGPLIDGEPDGWEILQGVPEQVGSWIGAYLDARRVGDLITTAFPIEGQTAAGPIDRLVAECAATLDMPKPLVYLRNSPETAAYLVEAYGKGHLVLTSGLLALYEDRPAELKFVVGRELGHAKCQHMALRRAGYGIVGALQAIDEGVVPARYQAILPTLALGRLYGWCRESEIGADRAGLLCCGEPKVAYAALLRQLHGLRAESAWVDPEGPDFDAEALLKGIRRWQSRPFVAMIVDARRQSLRQPFIPERLAALKRWADTGAYRAILDRTASQPERLVEVLRIQAFELAPAGSTADPYVVVHAERDGKLEQVLRTRYAGGRREARWSGFKSTDAGVDQPRPMADGQPLFFEIWDADLGDDAFIGGFVIHPSGRDAGKEGVADYTASILWDWKTPQEIQRPGYATVRVKFHPRVGGDTSRKKAE